MARKETQEIIICVYFLMSQPPNRNCKKECIRWSGIKTMNNYIKSFLKGGVESFDLLRR